MSGRGELKSGQPVDKEDHQHILPAYGSQADAQGATHSTYVLELPILHYGFSQPTHRCVALACDCLDLGPCPEQRLDGGHVPSLRRHVEGRPAKVVNCIHLGAALEQNLRQETHRSGRWSRPSQRGLHPKSLLLGKHARQGAGWGPCPACPAILPFHVCTLLRSPKWGNHIGGPPRQLQGVLAKCR